MNPASKKIDAYIAKAQPWQRPIMNRLRKLIHRADPGIVETWKWDGPCFEKAGIVCWTWAFKDWVNFTLAHGHSIPDRHKLFVADRDKGKACSVRITSQKQFTDQAILHYVRQIAANNAAGLKPKRKAPPKGPVDLPRDFEQLLDEANLLKKFRARPPYQQRGYLRWTREVKLDETKERRTQTMLKELRAGVYMPPKRKKARTP